MLKCDVRKYFYRINHDVLKTQLRRLIKDRDVLWLLDMIIDSTEGPGIPIGNHTSQWFAILYLSDMDHMIKERLGIKYYGRYMDDFYLIHEDRAYLQFCLEEIRRFLVPWPGTEPEDGHISVIPGNRLPGLSDLPDGQRKGRPEGTP